MVLQNFVKVELFNNDCVLQCILIMQLIVKMNIFMSCRRASFKVAHELYFSFIKKRYVEQRLFYAHDQLTYAVYTPIFRTFTCYRSVLIVTQRQVPLLFLPSIFGNIRHTRSVKMKRREKEKRILKSI